MTTHKKCGAPLKTADKKHSERLWVTQLTPVQLAAYTKAAKANGLSKSEWVRRALDLSVTV